MSLEDILGKKVVAYRLGDNGFDLIFEDGTELEVYLAIKRGKPVIFYATERYRWFPTPNLVVARREASRLHEAGIHGADVVVIPKGEVYIAVPLKELDRLKEICGEDESLLPCRNL